MTKLEQVARALAVYQFGSDESWEDQIPMVRAMVDPLREPSAEMLSAAAPFPLHLVIERNDAGYTKIMEAATASDRMAARSTYQTMIDAILS